MTFENTLDYARTLDQSDSLAGFRHRFHHPVLDGKPVIYFAGNSLGLMPKTTRAVIETELNDWERLGVEGHFHATTPWYDYHTTLTPLVAQLIGALESEVVCMNSLTVNLHLLFVSFYRPDKKRFKIISEPRMFPSDRYMLETQARFHGLDPDEAIIEVAPRPGEFLLREEDILDSIEQHRDELALVFFGAVNYYTGQKFDLERLTKAAHEAGALAGFDLAHAAGNVPIKMHESNADFAAWCSYKYMNSGAGNVGGIFVHQRHGERFDLPRFGGWWGHDKERRFLMENHFNPMSGAEGWQISNEPVFGMAIKKASLDIFAEAGMPALREKSIKLTNYLEFILRDVFESNEMLKIITPENSDSRGCQLSLKLNGADRSVFNELTASGVIADFREPDVIRMAPVPLYNTFEEIYRAGQVFAAILDSGALYEKTRKTRIMEAV